MARQIMFFDGESYSYPETLTTPAGIGAVKAFLMRVFKVLSSFRYLGYPEILEVGFDFESFVLFAQGQRNFYACYQFVKDSYPFVSEMVEHFTLQIVLPQLKSLSKS